jgi:hypothetical protein
MANATNKYSALEDKDADLRSETEELRQQVAQLKLSLGAHVELVDKQLVILGQRIDEGNSNYKECLAEEKAEVAQLYSNFAEEFHEQDRALSDKMQTCIEETRQHATTCIEETKMYAESHMNAIVQEKLKICDEMY